MTVPKSFKTIGSSKGRKASRSSFILYTEMQLCFGGFEAKMFTVSSEKKDCVATLMKYLFV